MILSRKLLRKPLQVGRRVVSQIDHNVKDRTLSAPHKLALLIRRQLVVKAAHSSLFYRKRNVTLYGKFMDAVLRKFLATPHPREESSLVVEKLRLQHEATTYRTGTEFYADAFPGSEREFAKLSICLAVKARTSSPFI